MAKITRAAQKIFGSTASSGQIRQFGSFAAGAPVTTTNPVTIQALSNFLAGWNAAVVGLNSPTIEDMNALFYLYAYQLAYLFQSGIPEWDADTSYYIGSLVMVDGEIFRSTINDNLGIDPADGTADWAVPILDGLLCPVVSERSTTVTTGKILFYPLLTIDTGHTYTINSGAYLKVDELLVVDGTLVINGTGQVL